MSTLDDVAAAVLHAEKAAGRAITATYALPAAEVRREARVAQESAEAARQLLLAMGAQLGPDAPRAEVPLELLDTPATRGMLEALAELVRAAEAVDRERGWVDDDMRPIGYAERYGADLVAFRAEVLGPQGRE